MQSAYEVLTLTFELAADQVFFLYRVTVTYYIVARCYYLKYLNMLKSIVHFVMSKLKT